MDDDAPTRPRPGLTPAGEAARRARLEREAEALRQNLRRRKAQIRAKPAIAAAPEDEPPCR